mmetsp:Transcript_58501/g.128011  ORF Transcript_58501/g.128011 Transcript_58501/m.128011 type:complete len:233 (-) Transcript_58501:420-1118(-)
MDGTKIFRSASPSIPHLRLSGFTSLPRTASRSSLVSTNCQPPMPTGIPCGNVPAGEKRPISTAAAVANGMSFASNWWCRGTSSVTSGAWCLLIRMQACHQMPSAVLIEDGVSEANVAGSKTRISVLERIPSKRPAPVCGSPRVVSRRRGALTYWKASLPMASPCGVVRGWVQQCGSSAETKENGASVITLQRSSTSSDVTVASCCPKQRMWGCCQSRCHGARRAAHPHRPSR